MHEILINPASSHSLLGFTLAFKGLAEVVSTTGHSALDKGCPLCTSVYTSGDCKAKEAEASILISCKITVNHNQGTGTVSVLSI